MSKLYDEPIRDVATMADGAPSRFRWRDRTYLVVERVAVWRRARGPGTRDADVFRVVTNPADDGEIGTPGTVCDLERVDAQWRLIRLWD